MISIFIHIRHNLNLTKLHCKRIQQDISREKRTYSYQELKKIIKKWGI